jgi:lysophospholipase L1-like esterase
MPGVYFDKNLHFSIRREVNISILFLITLLALPYLAWELYWYYKAGYAVIKWHTHLAVYFYLWLIAMWALKGVSYFHKLKNYESYTLLITFIAILLAFIESVLIMTGIGDTYPEKIGTGYHSPYYSRTETYYRSHKPYEQFYISRPEFSYLRTCNSLGYDDIEWPVKKKAGEKRYLIMGDSFTEGVGAPQDSCYPSILARILHSRDTNITVMNGASSGDDPCVNYVNYRDMLSPYGPDVIVQTLSANDMNTDLAAKGGLERWQSNGTVRFRPAPWWEPAYALSYISRIFFTAMGYNALLIKSPIPKAMEAELNKEIIGAFEKYAQDAKAHHALLLVALQPYQGEIKNRKYEYDMAPIVRQLGSIDGIKVYDLLPYYTAFFAGREDMIQNYYWRGDGHHNPKGYAVMAQAVAGAIDSFMPPPGGYDTCHKY